MSYLLLGDGDFSYSLDLCRYLLASSSSSSSSIATIALDHQSHTEERMDQVAANNNNSIATTAGCYSDIQVTATGIDSMSDLSQKYKNIDSILRKLRRTITLSPVIAAPPTPQLHEKKIDTGTSERSAKKKDESRKRTKRKISLSIHHSVNAIIPFQENDKKNDQLEHDSSNVKADHDTLQSYCGHQKIMETIQPHGNVIFNHPHLATENAVLHSRFLSHLFYSANHQWLARPGGVLHLTLVVGQFERWNCLEAAKRHGFVLLNRCPFQPPPPPPFNDANGGEMCYYEHRRHQSGRSFASRADGGSETLTFGRSKDTNQYTSLCLPWQTPSGTDRVNCETCDETDHKKLMFQCPHCTKAFREERSRKNHIASVHKTARSERQESLMVHHHDPKRQKMGKEESIITCPICTNAVDEMGQATARRFTNDGALEDHMRAKHSGKHTEIKPDWVEESNSTILGESCIPPLLTNRAIIHQEKSATNKDSESNDCPGSCRICGMTYKDMDAKLLHHQEFNPTGTVMNQKLESSLGYECSVCSKRFREKRALLQHENFCTHKTQE
mmetsp:Transcript_26413/g.47895  ORF Transcript_26413/g.47895 Transcript_26413/m.47895 type:complete len:558 (-) Transcript_26413:1541-3214(-)